MTTSARLVLVLALLVAALGGCGGDDDTDTPDTTTTTAEADGDEPAAGDQTVISVVTPPGSTEGFEGARDDVTGLDCRFEADASRWAVTGTVTNSTDATADYRIYVSFLDDASDTRGLLEVTVDGVAAGDSADWDGHLELDEDGLACTLRVERTPAA